MCGIVGYIGERESIGILLEGLKRLEYRGYDSCGIVVIENHRFYIAKNTGKINDLIKQLKNKKLPNSTIGIAHTRWATHGAPNKTNAHPHCDCKLEFGIVHNGIIENYLELKKQLIKEGHRIVSQTDTEIIAHLIEKFYKGDFKEAFLKTLNHLIGSFALAAISLREIDRILFARRSSPLIIGVGTNENFLASDVPAILSYTNKVIYLKDEQAGQLTKSSIEIFDFKGRPQKFNIEKVLWSAESSQKSGYPHFMLKEIYEQPDVSKKLFNLGITFDKNLQRILSRVTNFYIIACGTAYHAGMVGKYIIEKLTNISVNVDLSSEFRYRSPIIQKNSIVIAISQSGETADTLAAVRQAKREGAKIISICNVVGSTLTRESDYVFYTHAGPEIGVASTKAYTAQLVVLYLFALRLAELKNTISKQALFTLTRALSMISLQQQQILKNQVRYISSVAQRHHNFGSFLFLGRNINYPSALEGALKLKEISYIPAEGYAAGEMKHGPIALIDEYRAVVCIAIESPIYEKMVSNIQEIKSRKGKIVIIATEGNKEIKDLSKEVIYIPKTQELLSPLLVALPLQLFAYYVAVRRGCDVDQPRNLAKSVTVE